MQHLTPGTAGGGREVLMLGTSPETMGGIASVVRVYRAAGLFSRWPVRYLPTHVDGTPFAKLVAAGRAFAGVMAALIRGRDVILHVHSASRASFWRKCALLCPALWAGRPVLFHLHGGEFLQFYERECGPLRRRLVRYVLDNSALIIVLSETWRASLTEVTVNERIEVVMNPVQDPAAPFPQGKHEALILFLGRIIQGKGVHVLLAALAEVKKRHPAAKLVCAGDGALEKVRAAAADLGLERDVELPGWVDEQERADLLVAPGDVDALADGITTLLEAESLRAEMGRRARARYQSAFSAKIALARLGDIYSDLGVSPRSPRLRGASTRYRIAE